MKKIIVYLATLFLPSSSLHDVPPAVPNEAKRHYYFLGHDYFLPSFLSFSSLSHLNQPGSQIQFHSISRRILLISAKIARERSAAVIDSMCIQGLNCTNKTHNK
jgi:hypothetical protein